jgi:ATP-dependent RNA helicase DeaD
VSTETFAAMGCSQTYLDALERRGFTSPTPVQAQAFAPGLAGRDLLVQSRTGSGKTLAFGLPLMHRLTDEAHPQSLILAPTRELAQQVAEELKTLRPDLPVAMLVGGMSYTPQLRSLKYGAQVVVGTPGRVMDHLEKETLDLSKVTMVVLDECDEMLNMGFIDDVKTILEKIPKGPQTYLFSATLPAPIAALAKRFLKDPFRIQLAEAGAHASHADIAHTPCLVADNLQTKALVNILLLDDPSAALVFTKTKAQTEIVCETLREAGLAAEFLHGDLAQATRNRIMSAFKEGKLHVLVATDVAARGLDISGLPLVVHMSIPTQLESYIHRSGRTGRAGAKGTSLALVNAKESRILMAWARRGGLELSWRAVPSMDEIRKAKHQRLIAGLGGPEAKKHLAAAQELLQGQEPAEIVAALLSKLEGEGSIGYHIPEPTKFTAESRPPRSDKAPWKPGGKPADKPAFKPRPGEKAWERPAEKFEDRAHGPRKGLSPYKQKEGHVPADRRTGKPVAKPTGKPFFKKKPGA